MNLVVLKGNISYKGEKRVFKTKNGEDFSVIQIGLAVNIFYKGENKTNFVNIECLGARAELVDKFFVKGQAILIEGHLFNDSFTDKDGNNRNILKVVADKIDFCGPAPQKKQETKSEGQYDDQDAVIWKYE